MVTSVQVNFALNVTLHVLILFSFLTLLFFLFISHVEEKSVDDALQGAIGGQTDQFLTALDNAAGKNIDWDEVGILAKKIQKDAQGKLPSITENNEKLRNTSIIAISVLFVVFCATFVYFSFVRKVELNMRRILVENIIIFSFVGLIEYFFFTNVAAKYVPVTPDVLTATILERLKYRLDKYLIK